MHAFVYRSCTFFIRHNNRQRHNKARGKGEGGGGEGNEKEKGVEEEGGGGGGRTRRTKARKTKARTTNKRRRRVRRGTRKKKMQASLAHEIQALTNLLQCYIKRMVFHDQVEFYSRDAGLAYNI